MIEAVLFDMGGTLETYSYTEEMRRLATPKLNDLLVSYGIDLGLQTDELYQILSSGLKRYKELFGQDRRGITTDRIWTEYHLQQITRTISTRW